MRGNRDFQFTSIGNSRSKIARPAGVLVRSQGKKAKTGRSYHSESGPFSGVVRSTELRRSKERDWSFSQFAGFSERVQIMQDRTYRVLAALACVFWFYTPFVLESVNSGEGNEFFTEQWFKFVPDPRWKHVWIWTSFLFWPFSGLCCFNAFVDAKRRIGGWIFMVVIPFVLVPAVVIGGVLLAVCIALLSGFGIL